MIYGHIDGDQLGRQYKEHLSGFTDWDAKSHAQDWLVYPENVGEYLSIDETSVSRGELYTIVTNKAAHGGKGTVVAIVSGTVSEVVIEALERIPEDVRAKVKEITLDMSDSMRRIVRSCFPKAIRVIDRFHVQKLAYDALQEMRIAHRWDAINEETDRMEESKLSGNKYVPEILENGDSKKQLLARCRYLLFKSAEKWSERQKQRAKILFKLYPDIKKAYGLTHSLRMILVLRTKYEYSQKTVLRMQHV
jgi:transposase